MNNIYKQLAGFFTPPVFEGDENKTVTARILHIIVLLLLGTILIAFLLAFSGRVAITNRDFFTFSAIVGPVSLILLLVALRKGHVRFVAWAFVSFQWFTTLVQVIGSNGLESPALGAFTVTLLLAGFLISRQGVIFFGSLSVLSILGVWYLENTGRIPPPLVFSTAPAKFLLILSIIGVATVLLYIVMRRLQNALERSQTYAADLEQIKSRLEILHEIDRALLTASSSRQIAATALNRIRQLIPNLRTSVTLLDIEKNEATFLAADFGRLDVEEKKIITLQEFGQHIIEELQQNKPCFIDDITSDARSTELDLQLAESGFHTWLYVPLLFQGQLIGSLNLSRGAGNRFNAIEAEIAHNVANQLAISIQQTNLYNALQNELAERQKLISELEQRNDELTRFTYTVSHDLRSPLVTIKGFLGMLNKDIQDNRPDKVQSDFERIAGATDKMDNLLSDLLELSRIGRMINPPDDIDPVRLIQDARDSVDARIRSKNATIEVAAELPTLFGDRIRLREVFENLIDNAIKYMGDQTNPVVEIGVRHQNNEQVLYVKDNGMGIEEKYHEKIFGLFEKLDSSVEGTGIGLALVKRIIETHGGKIWVESDGLGKGSTFCFTIPDSRS